MDTEFIIMSVLILGVMLTVLFGILLPTEREKRRITGDTVNHDGICSRFVYKVALTQEQILRTLRIRREIDDLACTVDVPQSTIIFSSYGDSKEYFFVIQEHETYSIIKLKAVYAFGMSSRVPSLLNPFMVKKLNAELVPYSQYEDSF